MKSWSVVGKVLLHEIVIYVGGMRACKILFGMIMKTRFVKFCQKFMKKLIFLYIFFEKILLFQGVILKSNDFFVHIFYNIRL